ncbi:hypothetical protein EPI10_022948 [Gossypium australe]|uniref:Uncharacterized protein n=1 Tax=Gossypium australe TaxID=47621 RepID=A0A5B6VTF3_9ROSI|nr:hypothetical protein EPI10_022948 [Gossypium australe]
MEYDTSVVTRGVSKFMRIKVLLDVRFPLKRKKTNQHYHFFAFCVAGLDMMKDLSLKAAPRKGGQLVSKWLREEPYSDKRTEMEIDGEKWGRKFGVDVTNNSEFYRGAKSLSQFTRQIRKILFTGENANLKQLEVRGTSEEIEDIPVEFVDEKKRQRHNSERGTSGDQEVFQRGCGRNHIGGH